MTNLVLSAADFSKRIGHGIGAIDKAWVAVAIIFALIAAIEPAQAPESFRFVIEALLEIAPFLLAAIAIAAYAKASGADGLIAKVFEGRLTMMIVVAAIFGGLSPFCSCGVIPLIAALLAMGVPLPAVMAFWLASPLMDPAKFFLATGTLGLEFAIGLTVFAVAIGLYGGFMTRLVMAKGAFANPLRPEASPGCCATKSVASPKTVMWKFWPETERRQAFTGEMWDTTLFLLKWLALAFLLESLMIKYVPAESIAQFLGSDSAWAIPIAVLTGVPAYLNGFAALPLIQGLLEMGVAPGAGMAFLVAGAVTSMPAAVAVFALVRPPMFAWYLVLAVTGATSAGLLFQLYAG
ncbi:MAG: permease [Rhodospirillaceae bacterium]|nr:permease [Rhodospirillaceae bacterium]